MGFLLYRKKDTRVITILHDHPVDFSKATNPLQPLGLASETCCMLTVCVYLPESIVSTLEGRILEGPVHWATMLFCTKRPSQLSKLWSLNSSLRVLALRRVSSNHIATLSRANTYISSSRG